ncbi:hypothetical protein ELQ35_15640 [Peribacillus cavernae]|uniref:Uncharacterized protein n=1 Tax=Peribacillus cavernae TaxID=1674310 RepID=A0A3S0TYX6_9BACI|nr:hypothetical protein [Peribacillus cavernae]MDQ0221335.1 hypothetical protein [Peribacillus cavernae]RUQ27474.1 hypothetical protein ELQ35_15640 [Peribacillus cavernae]
MRMGDQQQEHRRALELVEQESSEVGNELIIISKVLDRFKETTERVATNHHWDERDLDLFEGVVTYIREGQFLNKATEFRPRSQNDTKIDITHINNQDNVYVKILNHDKYYSVLEDGIILRFYEVPKWIVRYYMDPSFMKQLRNSNIDGTIAIRKLHDLVWIRKQLIDAAKEEEQ